MSGPPDWGDKRPDLDSAVIGCVIDALAKGKQTMDEIEGHVALMLQDMGFDIPSGMQELKRLLSEEGGCEYLLNLGGDVVMSERGREVLEMAIRKMEVNEVIGESVLDITLDEDDKDRILGASEGLPG